MKTIIKIFLAFFFCLMTAYSQNYYIKGIVLDSASKSPLIGASVKLADLFLVKKTVYTSTNSSGIFEFKDLSSGRYSLEISFIGYEKYIDTIRIRRSNIDLGNLFLSRSSVLLNQIDVVGKVIPSEQKGDTIQFNALAFKTNPDATAEDLVTKIPGVQKEEGVIKAQGEEVKQVLVDGRQFFGEDPMIALRNLPAEIIEKVQIFDKLSEQAQFTGFDDGQTNKTINIITRIDRRAGQFGKLYGGYGTSDRYAGGGNLNIFSGERRISLIGLINNINQQNFSMQDIFAMFGGGGMGRGGRDIRQFQFSGRRGGGGGGFFDRGGEMTNFFVGGQDGNTNTYSFGSNLMDVWWNDLNVNASYFFNYSKNRSDQTINREYFSTSSQNQFYNEYSNSSTDNFNHRINARLDFKIDSLNSLLISPRIYFQDNSSSSSLQGLNFYSELNPINSTNNLNSSNTGGFNFSNELLFRHRFELEGRTISLRFVSGMNNKNSDNDIYSLSKYFKNSTTVEDTIDQKPEQKIRNFNLSSNLTYTEPIGTESQLLANVGLNFTQNSSDKKSFSFDNVTNLYNILDTLLSNEYTNKYLNFQGGLSYRLRSETFNFSAGVSYQRSSLMGNQKFPFNFDTKNTFENILPNAQLRLRFSGNNNIRVNYSTNINPPSITQLQNTIDNSNPLFLRTGNPELDAEYSHRLSSQILTTNLETGSTFFAMIFFGFTKNHIGNVTINATKDTLLPNGIFLNRGTQITYPVNFDHSLSIRSFINGGFPIDFIKCNLNLNLSFNYNLTPGLINEQLNKSKSYSIGAGTFISSNISEDLDFRISYNPTYNISKNELRDELNRNYFVHNASANFNWIFLKNFFIKSDFLYYYNPGITEDLKQKYYLWNAGLGIKFFGDRSAELKLEVFDILNQNDSLNKNITEYYIEDRSTKILRRYFLLTFTYNLRAFNI